MLFDLHVHSKHSSDSPSPVGLILNTARRRGLAGIAIADHNTLAGSMEAWEKNKDPDFYVIPAAEYATDQGHILAFFLQEELQGLKERDGLYFWQEVVAAIHEQGGLAFIAHPFKLRRPHAPEIWQHLDGVEIFNARAANAGNRWANEEAAQTAARYGLGKSAGSDAHWPPEIGRAVLDLPGQPGQTSLEEIKAALAAGRGEARGSLTNPLLEPAGQLLKAIRIRDLGRLPRIVAKALYLGATSFGRREEK
ncbi:MAG: hypothetical protein PWP65_557 [Clostridia bacterium]|nr:hypothetical protein [Clostridia bacterium]